MTGELLYSATDVGSRRSIIVINEGDSVWAYLTAPSSLTPVSDSWLMNLIDAPTSLADYRDNGKVPPATVNFTSQDAAMMVPDTDMWSSSWSVDGEAVAVLARNRVLAFIRSSDKTGFSRFISASGPFGEPFDTDLFVALFGTTPDGHDK